MNIFLSWELLCVTKNYNGFWLARFRTIFIFGTIFNVHEQYLGHAKNVSVFGLSDFGLLLYLHGRPISVKTLILTRYRMENALINLILIDCLKNIFRPLTLAYYHLLIGVSYRRGMADPICIFHCLDTTSKRALKEDLPNILSALGQHPFQDQSSLMALWPSVCALESNFEQELYQLMVHAWHCLN